MLDDGLEQSKKVPFSLIPFWVMLESLLKENFLSKNDTLLSSVCFISFMSIHLWEFKTGIIFHYCLSEEYSLHQWNSICQMKTNLLPHNHAVDNFQIILRILSGIDY